MVDVLELRSQGMEFTEAEVAERIAAAQGGKPLDPEYGESGPVRFDNVAVIPIQGVMTSRMNMFSRISGGTSTQQVGVWLKELAADSSISEIILDVDSGGGDAHGNEELVKIIRQVKTEKNIVAVVTGVAASAAYYVASAADTLVMTPSSEVGSIGTFMVHRENSKANQDAGRTFKIIRAGEIKTLLNDVEPWPEKA
ncbi:MAG: S49 family peptidase, partial [Arenibacter algicola]|nr:S49 family peptidase [Arenibacter algicola]